MYSQECRCAYCCQVVNCFGSVDLRFKLYLWRIANSPVLLVGWCCCVVNCFQIVSLRFWQHPKWRQAHPFRRCELLSNCIFEVLTTPESVFDTRLAVLWIAFKLYLWGSDNTMMVSPTLTGSVVNCFQIVSLRFWQHLVSVIVPATTCCELLSNCIFEVLTTPLS